jgi:hypothetical protein
MWLLTNSSFVCSNIYNLHAHHFVKNIVLRITNVLRSLKIKNQEALYRKTLTAKTFCEVCLCLSCSFT